MRCVAAVTCVLFASGCAKIGEVGMTAAFLPVVAVGLPFYASGRTLHGPYGAFGVTDARFSPQGDLLVVTYKKERSKQQHLYTISLSDGNVKQLTTGKRFDRNPRFSPDGETICFTSAGRDASGSKKNYDLFTISTDGTELATLADEERNESSASWSPSGDRILFKYMNVLYTIEPDGSNRRHLTKRAETTVFRPVFLDEDTVVFWAAEYYGHTSPIAASRWHDWTLYLLDVPSGEKTALTTEKYYNVGDRHVSVEARRIMWRPSETLLVLSVDEPSTPARVQLREEEHYWIDRDGNSIPRTLFFPSFTPGGNSILCGIPTEPPKWDGLEIRKPKELHRIDIETLEDVTLTSLNKTIVDASYSMDGSQIVFLVDPEPYNHARTTYELYVMQSDGTQVEKIDVNPSMLKPHFGGSMRAVN